MKSTTHWLSCVLCLQVYQTSEIHGPVICIPRGILWNRLLELHWVPHTEEGASVGMHDYPDQVIPAVFCARFLFSTTSWVVYLSLLSSIEKLCEVVKCVETKSRQVEHTCSSTAKYCKSRVKSNFVCSSDRSIELNPISCIALIDRLRVKADLVCSSDRGRRSMRDKRITVL